MINIGNLNFQKKLTPYINKKKKIKINIGEIINGVNNYKDFIIYKDQKNIKVYDRRCDHNGGKLLTQPSTGRIICPLHSWEFNPNSGKYKNVKCKKKETKYNIRNKYLEIIYDEPRPKLNKFIKKKITKIYFLNHACVIIDCGDIKFATDPWIFGPAFCNGWWLSKKSPKNSIELLNRCDFIFISHNHPDHLHSLTLKKIKKSIPIITANFKSKSAENYLTSIGFKNVFSLDFGYDYICKKHNFSLSILKSGDFRDDSGIYFANGKFTSILTVDSNFLNFFRFPKKISLLATSFASGASGYPLCFDNISEKNKRNITLRSKNAIKSINREIISLTNPKFYMPYAGFFKESARRDIYIKKMNKKNKPSSFINICNEFNSKLLDLDLYQNFIFNGEKIINKFSNKFHSNINENIEEHILEYKKKYKLPSKTKIIKYFQNSNYQNNIILKVMLMDDKFKFFSLGFIVDFRNTETKIYFFNKKNSLSLDFLNKKYHVNILQLKIRVESFANIINEFLPWEDMLIGFQARIDRIPNIYNSDFWYYFTNIYIKKNAQRMIYQCNSCKTIIQKIDSVL